MIKIDFKRRALLRWCGWFFCGNILLYWLIGLKYLHSIPWLNTHYLGIHDKVLLSAFLIVSYLSQLAILALLPAILIILLICVFPKRLLILTISTLIAVIASLLLLSDAIVYNLYHFHINGIIFNFIFQIKSEQFFDISQNEIILFVSAALGFLLVETLFAGWLWNRLLQGPFLTGMRKWIVMMISVCIYAAYSIPVLSTGQEINRIIIDAARILPLYTPFLGAMLPVPNGQMVLERAYERFFIQPDQTARQLQYPLHTLHFSKMKNRLNVVIIGIDTWRYNSLDSTVTPNIFAFAKQASVYKQHFSGGNATGPGIFSLFYGLPSTYWTATQVQKRGPLLIDAFLKHNYKMKILSSAGLVLPQFNKNVFEAVPNLKLTFSGENAYIRDGQVTKEFEQFIHQVTKTKEPFFSFIFYDAAHSFCSIDNNAGPFTPAIKKCDRLNLTNQTDAVPYLNRYKNSLRLVDEQVGEVIQSLKANHLLENTIIIITGDHGEEFNDNHLGYWGHSSNFTHYQVQTPLIIYWPGEKPKTVTTMTTHFDIAPTLMETVLGCQTPSNQYSIGNSLLNKKVSPYLIVGSYIGFGIVEPKQITTVFPSGFMMTRADASPAPHLTLNIRLIESAFQDMHRFYRD